ncbi:hypothetical protein niasHS_007932 [Heterodera schachtii]|uniref:Uncharacterized protein n=1 Tax=Heterodera schachtii TaxID=97005 RepID=A0ABD2JQM7_HETSC
MVYKRAYLSLNEACELQVDSDKLELSNPLYSDAFIHFISAGAAFCTKIKMGKSVNYPDLKANKGYNFFEELIEVMRCEMPRPWHSAVHDFLN